MCGPDVMSFVARQLPAERVAGRRVLEVGSLDVNGTARSVVEPSGPRLYLGIDLRHGPGVDLVCDVVDAPARLGEASFDAVVCTEVLEHVEDWRAAVDALKRLLRPAGTLVLTTRSPGFPLHDFPHDHWRFTEQDLAAAFADFDDVVVEPDPVSPGVFVAGVRPGRAHRAVDLSTIEPAAVPFDRPRAPARRAPAAGSLRRLARLARRARLGPGDLDAAEAVAWGFDERFRQPPGAGPLTRAAFKLRRRRLARRVASRTATVDAWFQPAMVLRRPPRPLGDGVVEAPPTFVGIGTSKSGTTWWYELIAAHPRWARLDRQSHTKELLYFDQFLARPFTDADAHRYLAHFRRREGELLGEWTPVYVDSPWVAGLLERAAPGVPLLVMLRDPVERAISDLRFQYPRYGHDFTTLDALEAARRSAYATLLEPWLSVAGAERLVILQYERCRADPAGELRRTWERLGVDDPCPPAADAMAKDHVFNPATIDIPPATIDHLREMLAPDAARLRDLFPAEIDLDAWTTLNPH